ncbi:probable ribonuclease ZC3H12B [Sycon ciliatum]|uniref:probable ribonuclease ZC3H12B n=1 Tax=Sycon ciliatum TaxID=27933 RepID=UPI0020AB9C56|eukprot:scpid41485/ scgid25180/ Probable ribonuclease ZC3H12C; MCP-induced protein 3; Zinc finger CCCH domain-containing protein 12C
MSSSLALRSRVEFDLPLDLIARLYGPGGQTWDRIELIFSVDLEVQTCDRDDQLETVIIQGDQRAIYAAKDYVLALCDNPNVGERQVRFPVDYQIHLQGNNGERHLELERASWARISFQDGVATVRGGDLALSSAVAMICDYVSFFDAKRAGNADLSQYDRLPHSQVSTMLRESSNRDLRTGKTSDDEELVHYGMKAGWKEHQIRTAIKDSGCLTDANALLMVLMKKYPLGGRKSPAPKEKKAPAPHVEVKSEGEASDSDEDSDNERDENEEARTGLRPIIIDGSNVAMNYSDGKYFACNALKICVRYFQKLGHEEIFCLVPEWRKEKSRPEGKIEDQHVLDDLYAEGILKYTTSRRLKGKRIVPYDDRYIVRLATKTKGVIVSRDRFRDLVDERKQWRTTIEKRLLQFVWAGGIFMPDLDPLGRGGPKLKEFLRFPGAKSNDSGSKRSSNITADTPLCSYGKKCTRGSHCNYRHPKKTETTTVAEPPMPEPQPPPPPSHFQTIDASDQYADQFPRGDSRGSSTRACMLQTNGIVPFVRDSNDPRYKSAQQQRQDEVSGGNGRLRMAAAMPQPPPPPSFDHNQYEQYPAHDALLPRAAMPPPNAGVNYVTQGHSYASARQQQQQQCLDHNPPSQSMYSHHQHQQPQLQPPAPPAYYYDAPMSNGYSPQPAAPYGMPQQHHADYDQQYAHGMTDYSNSRGNHTMPAPPPPQQQQQQPSDPRYSTVHDAGDGRFQMMTTEPERSFQTISDTHSMHHRNNYSHDVYHTPADYYPSPAATQADDTSYHAGYNKHHGSVVAAMGPPRGTPPPPAPMPACPTPTSGVDPEVLVQTFCKNNCLVQQLSRANKLQCREEFVRSVLHMHRGQISTLSLLVSYVSFELSQL